VAPSEQPKTKPYLVTGPKRPDLPFYYRAGLPWRAGKNYQRLTDEQAAIIHAEQKRPEGLLSIVELTEEQWQAAGGGGGESVTQELTPEEAKALEQFRAFKKRQDDEERARAAASREKTDADRREDLRQQEAQRDGRGYTPAQAAELRGATEEATRLRGELASQGEQFDRHAKAAAEREEELRRQLEAARADLAKAKAPPADGPKPGEKHEPEGGGAGQGTAKKK